MIGVCSGAGLDLFAALRWLDMSVRSGRIPGELVVWRRLLKRAAFQAPVPVALS